MMQPVFTLFGIKFHWYGLIVGLAISLSFLISLAKARSIPQVFSLKKGEHSAAGILEMSFLWILFGGIIGARLWHVMTDWSLYVHSLGHIFYIWNGGMSIIGGVVGGLIGWGVFAHWSALNGKHWWLVPDLIVFGLPFGQAIGRVGNYFNQELYGAPTQLPWALFIDVNHRLPDYAAVSFYHPLFAYEALAMVVVGSLLWIISLKRPNLLGTGRFVALYVTCYTFLRFWLDFLRLDRGDVLFFFGPIDLGFNQIILLAVWIGLLSYWLWLFWQEFKRERLLRARREN